MTKKLVRPMTQEEISESGWSGWCDAPFLYLVLNPEASHDMVMAALSRIARKEKHDAFVVYNDHLNVGVMGWTFIETKDGAKLILGRLEGEATRSSYDEGFNPVRLRS